ncbi:MAG: response regulator [Verrucomicrobiota bacterium]|jgi:phosphoribosyl 1,2-cyclic phosphodiesterase/CheY-like chemotaxis protein
MKTILIIDDDAEYRQFMDELLRQNGWEVLAAEEGEAGIRLAKTHRPAIIICDLLMPRCNGFQVCRALRTDESLRHTKVIITSGRDYASDRQEALAAGADEYLTKPIEPEGLIQLLSRLAGTAGPSEAAAQAVPAAAVSSTRVRFWGVRGSVPTPGPSTVQYGGNTPCVEVRTGGQIIILDAGTGLRPLGLSLMKEFNHQPLQLTLLLTHTHWDHIQGLPFFQPVYEPQNQLHILGYEGARHGLGDALYSQMDTSYFPVGLPEVPANVRIEELKDLEFSVGAVPVKVCYANHPGICVGYRLFTARGSVAYFPDNEPRQFRRLAGRGPGAPDSRVLAYARGEDQKITQFLRGADVLVMDAQYDCEEYRQHVGWGHGCVDEVVALALEAQVKRLFLFHHDPNHDDAKIGEMAEHGRQLAAAQGSTLQVEAAREGETVELA